MNDYYFKYKIFNEDLMTELDILEHVKESEYLNEEDIYFGTGYEYVGGDYTIPKFGAKMNNKYSFWALYHEVAHAIDFVEEQPERIGRVFFGMGCATQVEVNGDKYDHYITTQAVERECRVFAIESKLMEHFFGLDKDEVREQILSDASSLYLMNDFMNIKIDKNVDFKEKEKLRLEWVYNKIDDYYEKYRIEDILRSLKKVKDIRNYKNWSVEKLLDHSFHYVDVEHLGKMHNPFAVWPELDRPITFDEIQECLDKKDYKLCSTPSWVELEYKNLSSEEVRRRHIQKIAYFAINPPKKPISIDVGFPEDGIFPVDLVEDGNHRLAGSLFKGRTIIKAKISGSDKEIKERLLYGPNIFLNEVEKRTQKEIESKINTKISLFFKEIEGEYGKEDEYILNRDFFKKYCDIADKYHDNLKELNSDLVKRFKETKIEHKNSKIKLKIRPN